VRDSSEHSSEISVFIKGPEILKYVYTKFMYNHIYETNNILFVYFNQLLISTV
jgi:hypothetical protein